MFPLTMSTQVCAIIFLFLSQLVECKRDLTSSCFKKTGFPFQFKITGFDFNTGFKTLRTRF